jgi:hypothetical protein
MNKKSEIWLHFKVAESNTHGVCCYCGAKISIKNCSTANLGRHLRAKHPTIPVGKSANAVSKESDSRTDTNFTVNSEEKIQESDVILISSHAPVKQCASTSTSTQQSKIKDFVNVIKPLPVSKTKALHDQLLRMIVKEYHPFSIVEDAEFVKLLKMHNPSYSLPTRKTITESLLPSCYNDIYAKVMNEVSLAKAVALTTDCWTCMESRSNMAVTVHFIDSDSTKLKSFLLSCSRFKKTHTAENLSSALSSICREWGISNKVTAIVSDNAANIKKKL